MTLPYRRFIDTLTVYALHKDTVKCKNPQPTELRIIAKKERKNEKEVT